MTKLLKRMGWWRTDDGRWFRHCNEDGTERKGITSVEWAWKPREFGPYLGVGLTTNDGYSDNSKLFIGFLLGRVWLGFGKSNYGPEKEWKLVLNRRTFEFCWNCTDKYGNHEGGKHIYFPWSRILDFIFGSTVHLVERKNRDWEIKKGVIKMPEGDYPATFTYETRIWFRPRSPFRKIRYGTDVDIEIGIPFSGKGENSWDMGEDGLYGTGINGKTKAEGWSIERAALHVADCATNTRMRRGDPFEWPMKPEERIKEIEKQRAEREATK